MNERLLAKLEARGETLEERRERRAQKRAAHITTKFGYTADDNPFNDPNLHEKFTWKKKEETRKQEHKNGGDTKPTRKRRAGAKQTTQKAKGTTKNKATETL